MILNPKGAAGTVLNDHLELERGRDQTISSDPMRLEDQEDLLIPNVIEIRVLENVIGHDLLLSRETIQEARSETVRQESQASPLQAVR